MELCKAEKIERLVNELHRLEYSLNTVCGLHRNNISELKITLSYSGYNSAETSTNIDAMGHLRLFRDNTNIRIEEIKKELRLM